MVTTQSPLPVRVAALEIAGARNEMLDAMRGIAILLVIFHHVGFKFSGSSLDPVFSGLARIGWAGVDIFFAISGYLITRILAADTSLTGLRAFYIKRAFRIFPLYYLALVVFIGVSLVTGHDAGVINRIWINALAITAWLIPFLGENGVPYTITWSVSVEETAYLLFGALAFLVPRKFRVMLFVVAAAALAIRFVAVLVFGAEPILMYYFAPGRVDAIALGGLVALWSGASVYFADWKFRALVISGCVTSIVIATFLQRESALVAIVGYSVIAVFAALSVGSLATIDIKSKTARMLVRGVAFVGQRSYFIYLIHPFVLGAFAHVLKPGSLLVIGAWGFTLVVVAATLTLASASWRWFEFPLILTGRKIAARAAR